jgi:hypothetical protein
MKTLQELGLNPKSKAKVELWLTEWIQHFTNLTDGRTGNVYRANFEKMDLFYFTDCRDIVLKDANNQVARRKRMIVLQLLLRYLTGEKIGRKIKCTHCGHDDVYIGSRPSGGGHYMFCSKCGKTDVCTYPESYNNTMSEIKEELTKLGLLK